MGTTKKPIKKNKYIYICEKCGSEFSTKKEADKHKLTCGKNTKIPFTIIVISIFLAVMLIFYISLIAVDSSIQETKQLSTFSEIEAKLATPTIIQQKQPSERALKVVNYAYYIDSNTTQQKELLKKLEEEFVVKGEYLALQAWANSLDADLQRLVRNEAIMENSKREASRPIYNTTNNTTNETNEVKSPSNLNCTTSYIGNQAYTNCY